MRGNEKTLDDIKSYFYESRVCVNRQLKRALRAKTLLIGNINILVNIYSFVQGVK